ncbi:MAG: protein translocase subunit SecD [Deltaproteobacteria bacterium]
MDARIRNRIIIIAVVVLACILGLIGFPRNYNELRANVRSHIHMGLDLKGGSHLVLQVHVDDAVNITIDQALVRLRDNFRSKNIPADVQKKTEGNNTYLLISGLPQDKSSDLQSLVNDQFSDWDLARVPGDPSARSLTLKVSSAATIRNQAFTQAMETIRRRIDALGVTEPTIAEYGQGDYEMVIELPDVGDPTQVKDIIQTTAMLELKLVQDGPYSSREAALAAHNGILPPDSQLLPGKSESSSTSQNDVWYILNQIAAVTGRDLTGAQAARGGDTGGWVINFTLTHDGAQRFAQVTGDNVGKLLAIVLDNRVVSAPVIKNQISDRGQIEGSYTQQQASDLALVLKSGALPASITYLQEETVGPSLGADSIRHGVIASIVGFVAVMGFMLIYYKGAGINADVALILNLIILIAALAYFGATLTLPGIAGVILTVGMGVDSNVLIFERIREELRGGKAVAAAVAGGFQHAFVTIIDTHVTTVVSAAILFAFGTGPIRGFAVTLTIGLIANLFTSVFVSRTIFDFILERREKGTALSI